MGFHTLCPPGSCRDPACPGAQPPEFTCRWCLAVFILAFSIVFRDVGSSALEFGALLFFVCLFVLGVCDFQFQSL